MFAHPHYLNNMQFIDTHTHLYLPEFDNDRDEVIGRAIENGVNRLLLPNIDEDSIDPMMNMVKRYPGICYPMIGLHPTSVREDYDEQLKIIKSRIDHENFIAIGEIGIDLYWDKTYIKEQTNIFKEQIVLALKYDLPVVIHCRDSFDEIFSALDDFRVNSPRGVFHAFTGTYEQALKAIELGFLLGVGGIVTFKNAGIDKVISQTGADSIILETDSPYLAPTPNRGKRNESSYLVHIAEKVAAITGKSVSEIANITTGNAVNLFRLDNKTADGQ